MFQYPPSPSPEPGNSNFFATAPVAMITVSATTSFSSVSSLNGRDDRSIFVTVSLKIFVPKRSDCARNLSVISSPVIPSGKPGKFSTSDVVVS